MLTISFEACSSAGSFIEAGASSFGSAPTQSERSVKLAQSCGAVNRTAGRCKQRASCDGQR